ncbi:MAG: glycosyltransferase [Gammaproteobacteria bacterium]|nr:glycosyltransferase [Gammaproteobacteria bacterium]
MPVRNAQSTLDECLQSIRAQTFADFELLIVNDHSTDDSAQIVADFASNDHRCRVLNSAATGIVAALTAGLAQARSGLIARMDADDLMMPDRLARQFEHMSRHPDTVVLGSCVSQFPTLSDGYREYLSWQNQCTSAKDIRDEIFVESPFAHPSVMFRRTRIVEAGGYRQGDFPEDYELWLRLHALGIRMEKLPEVLLQWRDTPERLSRQDRRYRRDAFDKLRADYLAKDLRFRNAGKFVIWGAGRRTRKRCAWLLQKGFRPSAWIDIDPRKIGNRLDGVPVVAPEWLQENRVFVLGYVSNHGAREEIADWLVSRGYRRGRDFLMVG